MSLIRRFLVAIFSPIHLASPREHAQHNNSRDCIPADINETYISKWLQQNQHLLNPLEIMHRRREKRNAAQQCASQIEGVSSTVNLNDEFFRPNSASEGRVGPNCKSIIDSLFKCCCRKPILFALDREKSDWPKREER